MPWWLNPSVYQQLPAYQNPEVYYFLLKVLATGAFARMLWQRGLRGRWLFAGTWNFFFGLFLVFMLSMHSLVIAGLRVFDRPEGIPFTYDFYFFSLLLLGAVLIAQGVWCLRAATALPGGDSRAWSESVRASLIVLAIAVALIPIQFFGLVLTVFSLVQLGGLGSVRRAMVKAPAALTNSRELANGVAVP